MAVSSLVAASGGVTQKVQEFTSTGSFTVPSNCSAIDILLVGGGGGGGSIACSATAGSYTSGGGGAGAQVKKQTLTVTPGSTYTVTIGAGGAGGTAAGAGSKGTDSTFGGLLTALGGSPGGGADDGVGATFANSTIASGANVGQTGFGSNRVDLNFGAAGGAAGPATRISTTASVGTNTYNGLGAVTVFNGYTAISGSIADNTVIVIGGAAVDGIYGGGGCGGYISSPSGVGSGWKNVFPGPYAGSGGPIQSSNVGTNGSAGTANTGAGGGGGSIRSGGTATTLLGGAGGSGFARITYWS